MTRKMTFATGILVALCTSAAMAQTDSARPEDDSAKKQGQPGANRSTRRAKVESVQKVVRLQHADCHDAAEVLSHVLRVRAGVDPRTNSIIISAPADDAEAAVKLLREIDTPEVHESDTKTRTYRFERGAPIQTSELVKATVSRRTRFAFDREAGVLVVNGAAEDLAAVEKLVQEISAGHGQGSAEGHERPLQLSFFFVQGHLKELGNSRSVTGVTGGPKGLTARDKEIHSSLDKPCQVNFQDRALAEVLDELATLSGLNIVVIWNDLEGMGIDRDTPVTLTLSNKVSLRTILDLLLEQIGGGATASVVDGVIKIATQSHINRRLARFGSAPEPAPLPAVLQPVADALAENGFHQISLLAPLMIQAQNREEFEVVGAAEQVDGMLEAEIQGRASRKPGSELVVLEIEARLKKSIKSRVRVTKDTLPPTTLFEISSTLSFKMGDLVVLAASPGATDAGDAVALVARLNPAY